MVYRSSASCFCAGLCVAIGRELVWCEFRPLWMCYACLCCKWICCETDVRWVLVNGCVAVMWLFRLMRIGFEVVLRFLWCYWMGSFLLFCNLTLCRLMGSISVPLDCVCRFQFIVKILMLGFVENEQKFSNLGRKERKRAWIGMRSKTWMNLDMDWRNVLDWIRIDWWTRMNLWQLAFFGRFELIT
jgi:hypothetical protein